MKSIKILIALIVIAGSLHAQTENSSERLITQLKNGTAPGLLFAPNAPAVKAPVTDKAVQKESLISLIRKGIAPDMQFQRATAGAAVQTPAAQRTTRQYGTVASEQEMPKETIKTVAPPSVIPSQEEPKPVKQQ